MSYIQSPNSVQAPLNQTPQTQFLTQGIGDGIVRQNFENLNKVLADKFSGKSVEKANFVQGPVFNTPFLNLTGTGVIHKPGQLQVQIKTRGNPVKVKIAPFQSSGEAVSFIGLVGGNNSYVAVYGGWIRTDSGGNSIIISQNALGISFGEYVPSLTPYSYDIPLPAFEFEDVVPTGIYTYQFFFEIVSDGVSIGIRNVNVVAYELR